MTNHVKDRQVVAAAIQCQAEVIMTYNLKHYPKESIQSLNMAAKTPDAYLVDLWGTNTEIVVQTLYQQGAQLNLPRSIEQVVAVLEVCGCTMFAQLIKNRLGL